MRLAYFTVGVAGVMLGATLLRKQPLLSIAHYTININVEAPTGPLINNNTADVDALPVLGTDIAVLPSAEQQLIGSAQLIEPFMGIDRARVVADHIDTLQRSFLIWATRWYRQYYGGIKT